MKRILLKCLSLSPFLIILTFLYFVEYQARLRMKTYLTFNEILDQKLPLSGQLSEIMPRSESLFFVESSGATGFELKNLCVIESAAKYHTG